MASYAVLWGKSWMRSALTQMEPTRLPTVLDNHKQYANINSSVTMHTATREGVS